jgi:hypothetical protein
MSNPNVLAAQQTDIKNLLDRESTMLQSQKSIADAALVGQKRTMLLNDGSTKRTAQYTKIIIVIVVSLVASLILTTIGSYLTFIPSFVFDIAQIGIIAFAIIYGFLLYQDAQNRDNINFDEIKTPTVTVPSQTDISNNFVKAKESGDLLGSINLGTCIGFDCCSPGTHWNQGNSVCQAGNVVAGFTTMNEAYSQEVMKNFPFEFSMYAPY